MRIALGRQQRGRAPRRRPAGHDGVDVVDHFAERRVEPVARVREADAQFGRDPAGIATEHEDAVAHQHGLLDVMGDHQHRFDGQLALAPEVDQVGPECLGGQHVERGERLVHQQEVGVDDQRPGQADALAHAARKLLRIRALVAAEPDQVDRRLGPLGPLDLADALRLEPELNVLVHRQPRK